MIPAYSVENSRPNLFKVFGNYPDAKGRPVRFLAMETWSQERADKWIAEHDISTDGMIVIK